VVHRRGARPPPRAGYLCALVGDVSVRPDRRRASVVRCDPGIGREASTLSPAMPGCGPVVAGAFRTPAVGACG